MSNDPNTYEINETCELLTGIKIKVSLTLIFPDSENQSEEMEIDDCNIMGNCMESIVFQYIKKNIHTFKKGPPGQKPDYINNHSEYELKCFRKTPSFDIGSITGSLNDISKNNGVHKKLNTTYLVFEYDAIDGVFEIKKFWMLSVCDLCCGHEARQRVEPKPINIGGQSGVNIRPAGKTQWDNKKHEEKRNPSNFLDRIENLIQSKWYKVDESEKQQKLESIRIQRRSLRL